MTNNSTTFAKVHEYSQVLYRCLAEWTYLKYPEQCNKRLPNHNHKQQHGTLRTRTRALGQPLLARAHSLPARGRLAGWRQRRRGAARLGARSANDREGKPLFRKIFKAFTYFGTTVTGRRGKCRKRLALLQATRGAGLQYGRENNRV